MNKHGIFREKSSTHDAALSGISYGAVRNMKRHTIWMILALLPVLAAGPYRAVLQGSTLEIRAGETVVRRAGTGADLPAEDRAFLCRGVWTVNDAGLASFLEDYSS